MKKFSKRLLTLLITVSMLMSTVVLFATTSAASSSDPWILSTNNVSTVPTEGSAGTAFSIPVRVTNNTGFWAMAVRLSYDDTVLQFMGVERGTIHFCAKCDDNGNFSSIDPVATAGNGAGTTSFSQVVGLGKSLSCLGELVDDGTLFSANFRVRANQPDGTITSIIASVVDINGYAENETNPTNIVVHYDAPNGVDTGFIPVDATAVVSIEDAPEPIGAVAFTVAAPVTDGNPATPPAVTAIPAGAPYTVKSATWDTSDTFFRALSPYVAEIVLEATGSNIFDENTTVAVTGGAAVVVADPIGAAGKEMTIKRTFTTGTCCPTGACPCDMEMPETCPHHVSTNVITRDIEFVLALSGDTW
ncbi:MAG: cohesin domain-containing protein, partial [Oscillospiraceae bacterium]|nr:cohesin domain-containing protein [Oscillospiraceae bacterium]